MAVCDRLVHRAHRLNLFIESLRKPRITTAKRYLSRNAGKTTKILVSDDLIPGRQYVGINGRTYFEIPKWFWQNQQTKKRTNWAPTDPR
jgi:hypothetical protein